MIRLMELDHALIAVHDLVPAARELEARHGLASVEGGRHPGWGTANRIVPLGGTYLELIGIVDEDEAAASAFGRWVSAVRTGPLQPFGWAVRTDDMDAEAARLGLAVTEGSRARADGSLVQWRLAGVEAATAEPCLPFLIEWAPGTTLPGRTEAPHPAGAVSLESLELMGDRGRLAEWLGGHSLPVTIRPGAPGVKRLVLRGDDGAIAIGAD
jgi:hypothetical protein